MDSSNYKAKIVNTSCPYVVDTCARLLLRASPGTRFEVVGSMDELLQLDEKRGALVSLGEAAARCGYKRKTFYHWAQGGVLGTQHGVTKVRGRYRVNFPILKGCFDRGEFASCS